MSCACRKPNVRTNNFRCWRLQAIGYYAAFHGEKSYNGVAILSKTKPADVRASLCDEVADVQARVIAATIGDVRVFSVYAPNGQAVGSPAYDYKLQWYARLRACLTNEFAAGRHVVVAGDFNVAPEDEDVYDPDLWRGAIMCSDGERRAFQELCGQRAGRHAAIASSASRAFSAGGIIGCSRFRRIADCVLMESWRAKCWRSVAPRPELIARCAKARIHPITRRSGRNLIVAGRSMTVALLAAIESRCEGQRPPLTWTMLDEQPRPTRRLSRS